MGAKMPPSMLTNPQQHLTNWQVDSTVESRGSSTESSRGTQYRKRRTARETETPLTQRGQSFARTTALVFMAPSPPTLYVGNQAPCMW